MPVDLNYVNLAAGGILGGAVGYSVTTFREWRHRPRVRRHQFIKRLPEYDGGYLHKLLFELAGRTAPGECSLEISYVALDGQTKNHFAKWDEASSPIGPTGTFWPDMVPSTYRQVLHIGRWYTVPILMEQPSGTYIFSGWWYGRDQFPRTLYQVDPNGSIKLSLSGQGLTWRAEFPVSKVTAGPTVNNAESDSRYEVVRRFADGAT